MSIQKEYDNNNSNNSKKNDSEKQRLVQSYM